MSFKLVDMALETNYPATTKLLLVVLAEYADDKGMCYPSWETLMRRCSILHKSTLSRHIKILEKDGVLKRKQRFGKSNIYYIDFDESTNFATISTISTKRVHSISTPRVLNESTLTTIEPSHEPPVYKRGKKGFQKPTIEEIKKEIDDKLYHIDAEQFYHFYESKGWMIGKNKMKSWKSALANWNKNNKKKFEQKQESDWRTKQKDAINRVAEAMGYGTKGDVIDATAY